MSSDISARAICHESKCALERGVGEEGQYRMVLLVCRQTSYSAAEAQCRLEHNDWDPVAVIREYLNPDNMKRETSRNARTSTNQRIYGEIGRLMEFRNRNDERRQTNGGSSRAAQNHIVQDQAAQDQADSRDPETIIL